MKKNLTGGFRAALAAVLAVAVASAAGAQEPRTTPEQPAPPAEGGESWYYRPAPEKETLSLARQKAVMRGAQRMARLEALRWYGFSNSRPTAAALPYTTMYSPAWQMPGGRPFAWYTTSRPVVIVNSPTPVYR